MDTDKLASILSIVVIVVGVLVMFGWFFDISVLKSILPFWATMKFTTALCFLLSGSILFVLHLKARGRQEPASVLLPILVLVLMLIMGLLLISSLTGVSLGIEKLFVEETSGAIETVVPGRPSIGTMVSFILLGILGLIGMGRSYPQYVPRVAGLVVTLAGLLAVVGYLLKQPVLYFSIEGVSTAMAFHTALLFIFSGISSYLLVHLKTEVQEPQQNED